MGWLRGLILVMAGAVCATGLLAEDPAGVQDDQSKSPAPPSGKSGERKPRDLTSLENLKLPAGAVIVVCDDTKDALRLLPKAVVLTPEKYQEMLDQIEQGKRHAKEEKPEAPSVCRLSGQVEGEFIRLRARYEFRTERPRALIALGTARAWATSATLDEGKLPVLLPQEDGLAVQIETPGTYQLVLELLVPIAVRGSRGLERAVDVGLPRAAITTLENLGLPRDAVDIRVGGRAVRATRDPAGTLKLAAVPLGSVERLELIWKTAAPDAQKGPPVLTARGKVVARITDNQLTTDVELNLEVVQGETAQWSILLAVPAQAIVDVVKPLAQDERIRGIQMPGEQNPVLTIRLKEPSAEPLQVILQIRQPRGSKPIELGPCSVLGAFPQRGTLDVRAPAELRVRCLPRGEVSPREVTEEHRREGTIASFTYWSSQPVTGPGAAPAPWLTLETETVQGALEARVTHLVRRSELENEPSGAWRISSKFDLTPLRTGVDRLEVRVPAGWQYDHAVGATPSDLVEEVTLDPQNRVATIRLSQRQLRPFMVSLPGSFAASSGQGKVSGLIEFAAELPMLAGWGGNPPTGGERKPTRIADSFPVLDRGGQVLVHVPDGMELLAGPGHGERPAPGLREVTWTSERMPRRVELLLQALHPELTVQSHVDIILQDHQARVRQRLHYQFPQIPPIQVELQVPRLLAGKVHVVEGGQVPAVSEGRGTVGLSTLYVTLTPDSATADGSSHVVTLEYLIPYEPERPNPATKGGTPERAATGRRVEIPLVQPEKAARGHTHVRVWSDAANQVQPATSAWEELPLEIVADHPALPDLVLRGGLAAGLSLQLESRVSPLAGAVVDRMLVQATLSSTGIRTFKSRYVLRRICSRELEVLLPVPLVQAQLDVVLDGKRLTVLPASDPQGNTVRIRVEPELYAQPAVLEIACQTRTPMPWEFGGLRCTVQPPVLQDVLLLGRCRWLVDAPPNWILAAVGGRGVVEQEWGRRGWLLALRPTATANDLEGWLLGTASESGNGGLEPSLVLWSNSQGAVSLFAVSNQVWLLGCSMLLLVVCLVGARTSLPRSVAWTLSGATCAGLMLLAIALPGLIPLALYGTQPGLFVFLMILLVQWLLYRRHRRKPVFLPGFKRLKPGSSLVRTDSSNRRRPGVARDPSTVDAPPVQGSSSAVELREVE